MTVMKLRFPESDINKWADEYQYPLKEKENSLLDQRDIVLKAGYLTKDQLKLVAQWKSPRSAGHIDKNAESFISEITSFSLRTVDERSRIESLTLLDGIRYPTASVILHLFHKDNYPIIDYRALWSVQLKVPNQYSFSLWCSYLNFCRNIANRNSVDMRTLDRALWQYSKTNQ